MLVLILVLALLLAVLFGATIVAVAQFSLQASFAIAIVFIVAITVFYICLARAFIKGKIP
jgi:hypothetical protein